MDKDAQLVDEVPEEALRTSLDRLTAAQNQQHAAEVARKVQDEEVRRAAEEADETIGLAIEALEAERDRIRNEIEERIRELKATRSRYRIELLTGPSTDSGAAVASGAPGLVAGEETRAEANDGAEDAVTQAETPHVEAKQGGDEDDWDEVITLQRAADSVT